MLKASKDELLKLDAYHTAKEISQQPQLWKETFQYYLHIKDEINQFLDQIHKQHERVKIILTGAGTSAYVGETALPYLKSNIGNWEIEAVPTTTLVSVPYQYLKREIPTLLVSFARSGNSPESIASVKLGESLVDHFYKVTITCAKDGKLALATQNESNHFLVVLPEETNDQAFAMTSSYSNMLLMSLLIFDRLSDSRKGEVIQGVAKLGERVLEKEKDIKELAQIDFQRVVYLGSGSFEGIARESQLKILELTAGKIATLYDSPLGFRHGPKSFVNPDTMVVVYISTNEYTRKYDLDLLHELIEDNIAKKVIAIGVDGDGYAPADSLLFDVGRDIPDAYLALPYIMFAQVFALYKSINIGNTPDHPSPTGTVNRVVNGVVIHEFLK